MAQQFRPISLVKAALYRFRHSIFASRDQLDQIIDRLEMCESALPVDAKAALGIARLMRKRVYGKK